MMITNQRHDQHVVSLDNDLWGEQLGSFHPLEVGHLLLGPHLHELPRVLLANTMLIATVTCTQCVNELSYNPSPNAYSRQGFDMEANGIRNESTYHVRIAAAA
jgi:hypothetical protein